VTPHSALDVLEAPVSAGFRTLPGILIPTEAFTVLGRGADGLKLFPARTASPRLLTAMRSILPLTTVIIPVGGITAFSIRSFWEARADGYRLGPWLYRPDRPVPGIRARAEEGASTIRGLIAEQPFDAERSITRAGRGLR
jgi:2-dehydro-3-deoxyphosphogalactonate aldolase